jgi:hypothetical protein
MLLAGSVKFISLVDFKDTPKGYLIKASIALRLKSQSLAPSRLRSFVRAH